MVLISVAGYIGFVRGFRYLSLDLRLYIPVLLFFGVYLKIVWLLLSVDENPRADIFFAPEDVVVETGIYIAVIVTVFYIFYSLLPSPKITFSNNGIKLLSTLRILYFIFFLVCSVSFIFMCGSLGWDNVLSNISAKRFNVLSGGSGRMESSAYWYYQISSLLKYALYLFFASILSSPSAKKSSDVLFCGAGIFFVMFLHILLSQRALLLLFFLDLFLLFILFNKQKIRYIKGKVLILIALMLSIIAIVTYSRSEVAASKSIMEHLVLSRYLIDIGKTSKIVEHVKSDGVIDSCPLYGWIFIATPSLGSDYKKCFLTFGKYIGSEIYGFSISGVPPGLVGEMHLYWGYFGGITGIILLALFMFIARLSLVNSRYMLFRVIYVILFSRVIVLLFGNTVGFYFLRVTFEIFIFLGLMFFAKLIESLAEFGKVKQSQISFHEY